MLKTSLFTNQYFQIEFPSEQMEDVGALTDCKFVSVIPDTTTGAMVDPMVALKDTVNEVELTNSQEKYNQQRADYLKKLIDDGYLDNFADTGVYKCEKSSTNNNIVNVKVSKDIEANAWYTFSLVVGGMIVEGGEGPSGEF